MSDKITNNNSFEDELDQAFSVAGQAESASSRDDAFRRAGRFQLQNFRLGDESAVAEIAYFPSGRERSEDLKGWTSVKLSWGVDQLRVLIEEMGDGEERSYLETVEAALSEYSWLQWAVQDTGSHMRPDADLAEIGRRTKDIMKTLQPIRNEHALMPAPRRGHDPSPQ